MEITTQELPKSQCNNTDIKNTEFSDFYVADHILGIDRHKRVEEKKQQKEEQR